MHATNAKLLTKGRPLFPIQRAMRIEKMSRTELHQIYEMIEYTAKGKSIEYIHTFSHTIPFDDRLLIAESIRHELLCKGYNVNLFSNSREEVISMTIDWEPVAF